MPAYHEPTVEEIENDGPDISNPGILYSSYRGSDAIRRMEEDKLERIENDGPDIENPGILYSSYRGSDAIRRMQADRQSRQAEPPAFTSGRALMAFADMWADCLDDLAGGAD